MHRHGWSITVESGIMTYIEKPESVRAECIFGTQQLLPLIGAFSQEIAGVKTAEDSEHIHRMRVASRRLRAALPLFASCIPEKKYRQWMQEIQRITRALGVARDTDVQIAFLIKLEKRKTSGIPAKDTNPARPDLPKGEAETILLSLLQKKRKKLQTAVISALEKLENSGVINDMGIFFDDQKEKARSIRKKPSPYGIPPVAAARIARRLSLLLSHEQWVHNPDAIAEHHAIRIAAKKLRYTMEIYAPLYRRGLKKPLRRVKKIQEILGDLHDCDVWIDMVMAMLLKERLSPSETNTPNNMQVNKVTSYRRFLVEREKERKIIYRRFVRFWDSLGRVRLWDDLRKNLDTQRKCRYRFSVMYKENEIRPAVSYLATQYPEGLDHCRKVTYLALTLFDELKTLHRMGGRERFLLECAGLLHDIGWKFGQKGHAGRGAYMILSDENLPLGLIDRGIVALLVKTHQGKIRFESEGFFSLLSLGDRNNVLRLAALLRVADGLDYLHLGTITSMHSMVTPQQIIMEISSLRDPSGEKERALLKSDLLNKVFDRTLVIR
jgi:CHAD domain-containing protein